MGMGGNGYTDGRERERERERERSRLFLRVLGMERMN